MAGDANGAETQEEPQAQEDLGQQAAQEQPQVSGTDWERTVAEHSGVHHSFSAMSLASATISVLTISENISSTSRT